MQRVDLLIREVLASYLNAKHAAYRLNVEGILCLDLGKYEEATELFTKVISLYPEFAAAYSNRGVAYLHRQFQVAYLNQEKLSFAIKDFTRAIELDPNYAHAYLNRARAYREQGEHQFDLEIADYTQFIKLSPRNIAEIYNERGIVYRKQGNNAGALADFIKGTEQGSMTAYFSLKSFLRDNKDFSGINKLDLFKAIQKLGFPDQIPLLKACLDKNTALGKRMLEPDDASSPCSFRKSPLKDICELLALYDPTFIMPTYSDLQRMLLECINNWRSIYGSSRGAETVRLEAYESAIKNPESSEEELFKFIHDKLKSYTYNYTQDPNKISYTLHSRLAEALCMYLLINQGYEREYASKMIRCGMGRIAKEHKYTVVDLYDLGFSFNTIVELIERFKPKPYCRFAFTAEASASGRSILQAIQEVLAEKTSKEEEIIVNAEIKLEAVSEKIRKENEIFRYSNPSL